MILVCARANHPNGYGYGQPIVCETSPAVKGVHYPQSGKAHGYVTLLIDTPPYQIKEMIDWLRSHKVEGPFGVWGEWYGGLFDVVGQLDSLNYGRKILDAWGRPLEYGKVVSYGDNRAILLMKSSDLLDG